MVKKAKKIQKICFQYHYELRLNWCKLINFKIIQRYNVYQTYKYRPVLVTISTARLNVKWLDWYI